MQYFEVFKKCEFHPDEERELDDSRKNREWFKSDQCENAMQIAGKA